MAYIPDSGSVAAWLQSNDSSVITVQKSSIAAVIIGGSIAATFTPPANQSVSGTVQTDIRGSVAAVIIGGSIAATFTPPANQSVSGSVDIAGSVAAFIVGNASLITVNKSSSVIAVVTGSVVAIPVGSTIAYIQNSIAAVIIGGSVTATAGTQYLENVITPSVTGTAVMFKSNMTTSIMTVVTPATPLPVSVQGTVTALQGAGWSGSVAAVITGQPVAVAPNNSSMVTIPTGSTIAYVQNSIAAVIIGGSVAAGTQYLENQIAASVTGTAVMYKSNISSSILSVVSPATPLPVSVQGVVTALQGTTPWLTNQGGSIITVSQSSSIVAVVTGSVALASSVISVPIGSTIVVFQSSSLITREASSSIIAVVTGSVAAVGSTIAYVQNSVAAVIIGGSITATVGTQYLENQIIPSVTGTAVMYKSNISSSIMTVVTPATPLPVSVQGVVTALQGTTPWLTNQGGSIIAVIQGSSLISINAGSVFTTSLGSIIVVFQSSSLITREASSSIIAVVTGSVALASSVISTSIGSVITINQAQSIVGTYAEDSAHTSADKGLAVWAVRNDTMVSVTSADGDYSPQIVGPVGEVIVANSPINKWFNIQNSIMTGPSVAMVAAAGASIFNYITGVQIANDSAVFARVKFTGGLGSVLAWTVAPANGGSNIVFPNPIKVGENSGFSASVNAHASVYVTVQGFTAKI